MDRRQVLNILNIPFDEASYIEDVKVTVKGEKITVVVVIDTVSQSVVFEVKDDNEQVLFTDSHDYLSNDDFIETLLEITDIIKSPQIRLSNNGQAVEAFALTWFHWFGKLSCI